MAFEDVSGEDLNWFFDQWFLSKGHVIIHTSQAINAEENTVTLHIKQRQKITDFPIFKIPVNVAIWDSKGKRTEKIMIDSLEQTFSFSYSGELKNMLFDEEQMLLGKVYEDKPIEQFVHQYYNSSRYKARLTALNRSAKRKSIATDKLILDAINDKHWDIRAKAIELYTAANKSLTNETYGIIKNSALNDTKSYVRAIATKKISSTDNAALISLCKTIIANDQSYNVISTTLEKLVKLDSAEALLTARNLIKLNNPKLNIKAGDVLGSFGTAEDYPFLEKLNLIDKPKGEDELSAMIAYTLFIVRHDINLQEKSLAVFSW